MLCDESNFSCLEMQGHGENGKKTSENEKRWMSYLLCLSNLIDSTHIRTDARDGRFALRVVEVRRNRDVRTRKHLNFPAFHPLKSLQNLTLR